MNTSNSFYRCRRSKRCLDLRNYAENWLRLGRKPECLDLVHRTITPTSVSYIWRNTLIVRTLKVIGVATAMTGSTTSMTMMRIRRMITLLKAKETATAMNSKKMNTIIKTRRTIMHIMTVEKREMKSL